MQSEVQKIMNWKPSDEKEDPALEFPPKDEPAAAAAPKPKARKPAAPKAKPKTKKNAQLQKQLGWFIECVPIVEKEDGTLASDISKRTSTAVLNAKGVNDVMKKFRDMAATSPDTVSHHAVRFVKVEKAFVTKTRQVVDIEE